MDKEKQKTMKTFEELGWYVYALAYPKAYTKKHPKEKGIFYIGKGIYDRVLQHLKEAENSESKTDKLDTIRKIIKEGFSVDYYILRHQIPTEDEAYRIESVCIDLLSYKDFGFCCLKNDVTGHGENEFGIKTLDELEEQYGNLPHLQINDDSELLCICINQCYGKDDEDGNPISIYEAVRGSWTIAPKHANKCKYVIAEYHGISRGVFKVNKIGWQKCNDSERYFFEGKDVSEKEGKEYMNCILQEKKIGAALPFRYISKKNCVIEKEVKTNYKNIL